MPGWALITGHMLGLNLCPLFLSLEKRWMTERTSSAYREFHCAMQNKSAYGATASFDLVAPDPESPWLRR
jgi:hypothetical protein